MSSFTQLIAVLVFLCYSAAYLFFVAWASERANGPKVRLRPRLGILLLGVGIVLPITGLCFLMQA